jgi:hypothetical protein
MRKPTEHQSDGPRARQVDPVLRESPSIQRAGHRVEAPIAASLASLWPVTKMSNLV